PTAVFAARMAHIARHYQVLALEELVERLPRGAVPRNALALTFDDGYRDNLTHAAPVLKRLGLPATIFVVTGLIDTPRALWFDRLAMAFKSAAARCVEIAEGRVYSLTTLVDRLTALDAALAHVKQLPDDKRILSIETLVETLRPKPERPKRLML